MGRARSRTQPSVIRRLRKARNRSTKDLAGKLQVPVAELVKWEKGAAQPSPAQWSDLAYLFGCSARELKEYDGTGSSKIQTNAYYLWTDQKIEDGWWGHFGVRLPGHTQSRWYPITLGTANRVAATLGNSDDDPEWMIVDTLNNRLLVINPMAAHRLWLLDEAQDEPPGDWSIPIDGYAGQPAEFYKVLDNYIDAPEAKLTECVKHDLEAFTDELDLGREEVYELLLDTHVHDRDGRCTSYWVDKSNLLDVVHWIEIGMPPRIFNLSCDSFDSYFPAPTVAMIDMPRMLVLDAMEEEHAEEAEDDEQ